MSNLEYYKRALKEVQESGKNLDNARGYWFYIESRNPSAFDIEDNISLYSDVQIEPILTIPWTEKNLATIKYIVSIQNLTIPALRHIICLEDAVMGLTTEEFKAKLISELAEDV